MLCLLWVSIGTDLGSCVTRSHFVWPFLMSPTYPWPQKCPARGEAANSRVQTPCSRELLNLAARVECAWGANSSHCVLVDHLQGFLAYMIYYHCKMDLYENVCARLFWPFSRKETYSYFKALSLCTCHWHGHRGGQSSRSFLSCWHSGVSTSWLQPAWGVLRPACFSGVIATTFYTVWEENLPFTILTNGGFIPMWQPTVLTK